MSRNIFKIPLLLALCFSFSNCASPEKKKDTISEDEGKGSPEPKEAPPEETTSVSATRKTLVQSFSNNPMTSKTISRSKADQFAAKLEPAAQANAQGVKDKRALEGLLTARRLAGKGLNELFSPARQLAEIEMRRGVDKDISDDIKLELALGAMQSGNYSFAEFYLSQLSKSKDAGARAGALNALGVIALRQKRVPEAVALFKQSLQVNPNYRAAQLNLGFLALYGGDLALAKKMLSDMQEDWFAQSGLLVISRLENDTGRADSLCEKVLSKKPDHRPTLFNCGLHEYQAKRNFDKAKQFFDKLLKVHTTNTRGTEAYDEKAMRILSQMDNERASDAQKKSEAEGQKKQAEGEAQKKAAEGQKKADDDKREEPKAEPKGEPKKPAGAKSEAKGEGDNEGK